MRAATWTVVILLVASAAASAYAVLCLRQPYQGFPSQGVFVDVPRGASRRTIAHLLDENGVVRNRWVFEILCRWRSGRTLQAGEYFFDRPATSYQVFDALANGRVYVRTLVVPEGYSMFDIADLVQREGFTTREDFLAAARDPSPVRDLAPNAPSLEGFLFPATYEFPRHIGGEAIVTAMVKRFRREWGALVEQRPAASPVPVVPTVTLASLVERETPEPEERPIVASVFTNRLERHLPLQCDPTVVYALELAGQPSDGPLQARNIPFESPYNTYRHAGLPPGPIANPGDASLRAALDPSVTKYLYFVANTEGGHFFGKTLAEHNRNVAVYRKLLTEQRKAEQAAAAAQSSHPER